MSKHTKKFMYILFAAIAIAALLLPAPSLVNHTVEVERTEQAVPALAWDFRDPGGPDGFNSTQSYTWAG